MFQLRMQERSHVKSYEFGRKHTLNKYGPINNRGVAQMQWPCATNAYRRNFRDGLASVLATGPPSMPAYFNHESAFSEFNPPGQIRRELFPVKHITNTFGLDIGWFAEFLQTNSPPQYYSKVFHSHNIDN